MISPSCSIAEFVSAITDKGYSDILLFTDQEATEAERRLYKKRAKDCDDQAGEKAYAESLKGLICYMRYTVKPGKLSDPVFPFFEMISKNLEERN